MKPLRLKPRKGSTDGWQKASIVASIVSTVVVGGMGVVVGGMGVLINRSNAVTSAALSREQLEFSRSQAESTKNIQEGEVVSTLLKQLFESGGKHRSPILTVLESHMTKDRYAALCAAIAQDDSDAGLRLTAIRRLGATSSVTGATVLSSISQDKSRTADERQLADQSRALIVGRQRQESGSTPVAGVANLSPYSKVRASLTELGNILSDYSQAGTVQETTQNQIDRCCRFGEPPLTSEALDAIRTNEFQSLYDHGKDAHDHYLEWVNKFAPIRQDAIGCLPLTANQITADSLRFRAANADASAIWDLNRIKKDIYDPKRFDAIASYVKDLAKNMGDYQACGK